MFTDYLTASVLAIREQLRRSATPQELWQKAARAEKLLSEITPAATYNACSVAYELDAVIACCEEPELVSGEALQHDLRRLIEDLSDASEFAVEQAGEAVALSEELADEFGVSLKTIHRWREGGLVARRLLFDDRKRVGFLRSSVKRFVQQNRRRVERASRFSKVSSDERRRIVDLAKRLDLPGARKHDVILQIAASLRRSPETVRDTLRRHAERHPAEIGFLQQPHEPGTARQRIYERYLAGYPVGSLAKMFDRSEASIRRVVNKARAAAISSLPLDYVASSEFDQPNADAELLAPLASAGGQGRAVPAGLPAYLAALYDTPLLTRGQERHLFRKYNYLKYRAALLRDQLDPKKPSGRLLDRIEQLYDQSVRVKQHLVRANLRLVVALAKKRTDTANEFEKLISDGNVAVLRAVEKFDYRLGNKFSTYATWAVLREFANSRAVDHRQRSRYFLGTEELLQGWADYRADHIEREAAHAQDQQHVQRFLARLSDRERSVIERRYGLGPAEPQTLKAIGEQLGVSKERVRQIEKRAIEKLRAAAKIGGG